MRYEMLKISVFLTLNGFFAKIAKNTKKIATFVPANRWLVYSLRFTVYSLQFTVYSLRFTDD